MPDASTPRPATDWGNKSPTAARSTIVAMLVACWVVSHPWQGLHHDGVLYAGQALAARTPELFAGDPFFAGSSQAGWSLFGWLHGVAVDAFGLQLASVLLWGSAQLAWILVIWHWAGAVLAPEHRLIGAATVIGCRSYYGSDAVLAVAESFLTARTWSEPLVAAGLLLIVSRKRLPGWALIAAAMACHPLMALPGVIAGVTFDRWPWLIRHGLLTTISLSSGLVLLVSGVYSGLLPTMDPEWYPLVLQRSPIVILDTWGVADWTRTLLPIAVLLAAARVVPERWCRIWLALAACSVLGLLLASVASLTRWELGLQVQFWRWTWLAAWTAPLSAIMAATTLLAREGPLGRSGGTTFFAAIPALAFGAHDWLRYAWALQGLFLIALLHIVISSGSTLTQVKIATHRAIALTLVVFAFVAAITVQMAMYAHAEGAGSDTVSAWSLAAEHLGWATAPLLAAAAQRVLASRNRAFSSGLALAPAFLLLLVAILAFDGRGRRALAYDQVAASRIPEWSSVIPPDAVVFWPDRMPAVWFGLERSSYASFSQLAGVVFNRSSIVIAQRLEATASIAGSEMPLDFRNRAVADRPAPTAQHLINACSDPALDFLVLAIRFEGIPVHPVAQRVDRRDYYLYACAYFRTEQPRREPTARMEALKGIDQRTTRSGTSR